ncbi:hypothetical protein HK098_003443 [Nowakowskiella sp. JEL0407]|nr:hypothetical protein HK098_003443 [Nowakowskiella sp. JEL0407]
MYITQLLRNLPAFINQNQPTYFNRELGSVKSNGVECEDEPIDGNLEIESLSGSAGVHELNDLESDQESSATMNEEKSTVSQSSNSGSDDVKKNESDCLENNLGMRCSGNNKFEFSENESNTFGCANEETVQVEENNNFKPEEIHFKQIPELTIIKESNNVVIGEETDHINDMENLRINELKSRKHQNPP